MEATASSLDAQAFVDGVEETDRYLNPRPAWVGTRCRDLRGINLHEHVRRLRPDLARDVRLFLVETIYDASGSLGFACARQSSYAARVGRTERTLRTYRRKLEAANLHYRVDTQGVDRTYINWEALELQEVASRPFRSERAPRLSSLRSPRAPRTGGKTSGPTGNDFRSYSLDHRIDEAPAETAAPSAPSAPPEPAAVVLEPRLVAACIRQHGADAFRAVEQVATRPGLEPEHVRQALVKLAITPAPEIKLTPIAAFLFWARCAAEGTLSLPKDDPAGGTDYTRLWHAQNAAHAAGDADTAARLAQARHELGQRDQALAAAREQVVALVPAPVAAQLSPPARAALADPAPKSPPPKEPPPALELLRMRYRRPALPAPPPSLSDQLAAVERRLAGFLLPADRMRLEAELTRLRTLPS